MRFRWLTTCAFLALVFLAQRPCSGLAGDHSSTNLLRESSVYAARMDAVSGKEDTLLSILFSQEKVGDEAGATKTAELVSHSLNKDRARATVLAIQASKGNITGATQTLARISDESVRTNALAPIAVAYAAAG